MEIKDDHAPGEFRMTVEVKAAIEIATHRALNKCRPDRALAVWCGTSPANVSMWRHHKKIPSKYVIPVAEASGIAPEILRPDLHRSARDRVAEFQQMRGDA